MKMRKVENFDAGFSKNGAYLGALHQKSKENGACEALSENTDDTRESGKNGAYFAPNSKTPEDEKFILEYGESLAEGDLRPILLKNYNGDK